MAWKPALKIHTWIGIASGVFLSVIALTGGVILFRAEFERAALPPSDARGDGSHRNAFSRVNYAGYVGNLSSPFFERPISALPARRLQLTVRFKF
jgi:hypothetical protein